jgi:hypothetical protein
LETGAEWYKVFGTHVGIKVITIHRDTRLAAPKPETPPLFGKRLENTPEPKSPLPFSKTAYSIVERQPQAFDMRAEIRKVGALPQTLQYSNADIGNAELRNPSQDTVASQGGG